MLAIHSAWPFRPGEYVVWDVVAAVDLLEYTNDDRAHRVALELLETPAAGPPLDCSGTVEERSSTSHESKDPLGR
jgi:hypothetical protein